MIIAQDSNVKVMQIPDAVGFSELPQDVKDAINAATPPSDEVFNVGIDEIFEGQVLRYDRIQFSSSASLTFLGSNDFVAIVADELLFAAPLQSATIKIMSPPVLHGENGKDGTAGKKGGEPEEAIITEIGEVGAEAERTGRMAVSRPFQLYIS